VFFILHKKGHLDSGLRMLLYNLYKESTTATLRILEPFLFFKSQYCKTQIFAEKKKKSYAVQIEKRGKEREKPKS
jgi:hypothetical protein